MKNKKILVCLKFYKGELNPFDASALECALLSGSESITVVAMAPKNVEENLKGLTRLGVKAVLVTDTSYAGSDTFVTSLILEKAIKKIPHDIIFCGRQSIDGDTAQVPPMLAERLGYEIKTGVVEFNGDTVKQRSGILCALQDKTIYTFEKIKTLRFPSIFSKVGVVETFDNTLLNLPLKKCGINGSPTKVVKSYESVVGRRFCKFVDMNSFEELIRQGLRKIQSAEVKYNGEKLEKIFYVGNVKSWAESLALEVVQLTVNGKTPNQFANELRKKEAKIILWEDSEELKIFASRTAVLVGAGVCADCISFRVVNGKFIMTRPALGGNVTADIACRGEITFATVSTIKDERSEVIFSIGKGAVDQIKKIKEYAEKFKAEICGSRVVVDNGVLSYDKQVGLTGRAVCPKVYVAFGISGAVQHTCAITGAGTVIAINSDKNARIFDYADYGIIEEIKNVKL